MLFILLAAECQGRPLSDINSAATYAAFLWGRLLEVNYLYLQFHEKCPRLPAPKAWCKMSTVGVAHKMQITDLCKLDHITYVKMLLVLCITVSCISVVLT